MTPLVCFFLGEPGVGKTTAVRFVLQDVRYQSAPYAEPQYTEPPAPKWTRVRDVVAAGYYKGQAFDGADTIPYNGARAALEYWRDQFAGSATLTILDGARFATKPSLAFLREVGARVIGVHLVAGSAAEERRRKRATAAGVPEQNKSWVKGAASGAANFAAAIGAVEIDAGRNGICVAGSVIQVIQNARKETP